MSCSWQAIVARPQNTRKKVLWKQVGWESNLPENECKLVDTSSTRFQVILTLFYKRFS